MFSAMLPQSLDKETYKEQIRDLMRELRSLQHLCWQKQLPVIIVLEGWAGAGKGALVKKMVGYMDPRGFIVHPIWPSNPEELRYPFLWRFWQKLPARGQISIFYHSWYTRVLEDRLFKRLTPPEVPMTMGQINSFERQLADDGAVIAKFWLHLSQKELKRRLKKAANDQLNAWRIRPEDWQQAKHYETYSSLAEEMIIYTSTGPVPWTLVESDCRRYAQIKVLSTMVARIKEALERLQIQPPAIALPPQEKLDPTEPNPLAKVDLSQSLSSKEYKQHLTSEQVRLSQLQRQLHEQKIPVLILFEGWDAAGKGGAIKRLTDILDPRSYEVHAFSAPTQPELAHHYLWRFWRDLPAAGKIAIFDRTWYGRVLVERVETLATEIEWRRAYQEINQFEDQLTSAGYVLVKFWLQIDPDTQLQRFQERQGNPYKRYKLTDEDWRNREKWPLYEVAVNQMIQRTHTPTAPWSIVAANDKYYARVKVVETVVEAIQRQLEGEG
ncbi:MAG: polyphosphate:AMP phosphotransferase [Oscillatoriales cyanobacterium RM1_1_9]|nr:polyphosphate:AMP phosphotransferase [Oscillatoriales cyanobacterium SM2_3_0]NJO46189.1 polyphosphate:AMP phosphotransferase [Oscillatoriales cyanobacterium RM2_1_1]NJO71541.1 polyphosphate:AMP phosphotransferase [Oscillatoriales cyanobacterium RM1_1_9]